jgi:Mg-chelatase subunit ChlD
MRAADRLRSRPRTAPGSRGPRILRSAAGLAAALAIAWGGAARAADKPDLELTVAASGVVRSAGGERVGFLSGSALAFEGELDRYDVVFVVDVSGSTAAPSGADIDGDGAAAGSGRLSRFLSVLPFLNPRPRGGSDSILAAEIASVRALLDTLDARNTRAALVSFSGGEVASADNANLDVALTPQFGKLREGLDLILAAGPEGATDIAAGLRIARAELRDARAGGASDAQQRSEDAPRGRRSQQHVVLLTDGVPEVPYEPPERTEQRAVQLARRMGEERIRVHAYAIGPQAVERPRAAVAIAKGSGGEFKAVQQPADLVRLLPELRFARIEEVRVVPLDAPGSPAVDVSRSEDGTYSALVPLRAGANRVEVYARASDGREKRVTAVISAVEPNLSDEQRAELARLLEIDAAQRRARERGLQIESDKPPVPDAR